MIGFTLTPEMRRKLFVLTAFVDGDKDCQKIAEHFSSEFSDEEKEKMFDNIRIIDDNDNPVKEGNTFNIKLKR